MEMRQRAWSVLGAFTGGVVARKCRVLRSLPGGLTCQHDAPYAPRRIRPQFAPAAAAALRIAREPRRPFGQSRGGRGRRAASSHGQPAHGVRSRVACHTTAHARLELGCCHMPKLVGSIDQGTSSTRFLLFDDVRCLLTHTERSSTRNAAPRLHPGPDWPASHGTDQSCAEHC